MPRKIDIFAADGYGDLIHHDSFASLSVQRIPAFPDQRVVEIYVLSEPTPSPE
jgi:hypothetical protein